MKKVANKYEVYGCMFSNKLEIIEYVKVIRDRYIMRGPMDKNEDFYFMCELFKKHHKKSISEIISLEVDIDEYNRNYCFYITTEEMEKEDISFIKAINNI